MAQMAVFDIGYCVVCGICLHERTTLNNNGERTSGAGYCISVLEVATTISVRQKRFLNFRSYGLSDIAVPNYPQANCSP